MDKTVTLSYLQQYIKQFDYQPDNKTAYFLKLTEEVDELAEVIRKDKRHNKTESIKGTIEEELVDVLYYVISLANVYEINLEKCFELKDKLNKVKWNRE
jgi:NTP pyrophosphatase (non-canonical NTP hydrolase)